MRNFTIVTIGCQMNQHDSERMAEVLHSQGYGQTSDLEQADLVLVNTCSVREKADQKLRSEVGRLGVLKRRRPGLMIGVAGCVAQEEGARLLARMPQIDLLVGPDNIAELPQMLHRLEAGEPRQVRTRFDLEAPKFLSASPDVHERPPTAYVTVMKGCNERCSFCIVPHTRGPERYRPSPEIVDEIRRLVDAGVREVTLLGQTVNSYVDPSRKLSVASPPDASSWQHTKAAVSRSDESEFSALLMHIAQQVPALARLRYTSPHPRHLTRSLIRAHGDLPLLARHVHMPVQSGSDRVLRRMIRRYSVAEYLERTHALTAAVPGLTLSTDVIVGFPGETREDFEQTLALVERVGFTGLFGFKYSPRPHTPALKLADDVPERVKDERLQALFEVSNLHRQEHLASLVGNEATVLVEGQDERGQLFGRTERNEIVHFLGPKAALGRLVVVRIARANKNSLSGELSFDLGLRDESASPRRLNVVHA